MFSISYDIYLKDPVTKETINFDTPHLMQGGTYCDGGTTEAWLNITWNYAPYYREHIDAEEGIRFIYGKTGADSIPILEKAVSELGDDTDPDYWESCEGNAKKPLLQLIAMAKMRPDGIWDGD